MVWSAAARRGQTIIAALDREWAPVVASGDRSPPMGVRSWPSFVRPRTGIPMFAR